MSILIRHTLKGTTIRATGEDALHLLHRIASAEVLEPRGNRALRGRAQVTHVVHDRARDMAAAGVPLGAIARELRISKTTAWKIKEGVYPMTKALNGATEAARSIPIDSKTFRRTDGAASALSAPGEPKSGAV